MKICMLIPGNMIGGGVKMPVRLASHLSHLHEVTLMYPLIPHYTTYHKLQSSSNLVRLRYILSELTKFKKKFVFENDLSDRVHIQNYFLVPQKNDLQNFDVIIYVSVWQYHELHPLNLNHVCKIHWSLADYLFCSTPGPAIKDIMSAYTSEDIVIAPSAYTRRDLESYGISVRSVIHGGIDHIFHNTNRIPSNTPLKILGYFQPAWWVKGASTLTQCLLHIRRKFPKLEISLFGHQASKIVESGLCDHFYTNLNSQETADLYRRHDIFIYPSYSDGFQSPPLEAMACGCAVVATNLGAVSEYAQDERNALLCPAQNHHEMSKKIERLILDPELRKNIGNQAATDASQWKWETCAKRFEELFEQIC